MPYYCDCVLSWQALHPKKLPKHLRGPKGPDIQYRMQFISNDESVCPHCEHEMVWSEQNPDEIIRFSSGYNSHTARADKSTIKEKKDDDSDFNVAIGVPDWNSDWADDWESNFGCFGEPSGR